MSPPDCSRRRLTISLKRAILRARPRATPAFLTDPPSPISFSWFEYRVSSVQFFGGAATPALLKRSLFQYRTSGSLQSGNAHILLFSINAADAASTYMF